MNNVVTALRPTTAVDDDLQAPDWRTLLPPCCAGSPTHATPSGRTRYWPTSFSQLAGSRLVVLDSAWHSASAYPGQFAGIERQFDLLDKLLFPYLDAINAGTLDTQARSIFGSKAYSAKESETTLSDARLRAMREFIYQGERRLFERHLRISNQTGLEGMRLYFDIIDGQVVISYVGPHLPVSTSN